MGWLTDPVVSSASPWLADPEIEDEKPVTARQRAFAGLGGINRGIAGIAGLAADTGENILNLGLTGYGAIKNLATGRHDSPPVLSGSFGGSQHIASLLEKGGAQTTNPRPDDQASRLLNTGGQIVGGSLFPGARPIPTAAAATGGAIAGETLGPEWVGVGAMAPATTRAALSAGRQALPKSKAQANAPIFAAAGVKPSVGLATENQFANGVENLLGKFPGSAGIITRFREQMQRDLGAKTKTGVSAEDAGRAIERGITGPGGFLDKTKAVWQALDQKLAAKVPQGTSLIPFETTKALDELTASVQGAERTTGNLANPKLAQMRDSLAADITPAPAVPRDHVRLFRGESKAPPDQGKWYTSTEKAARFYAEKHGGRLSYIDLPANQATKYKSGPDSFFLPKEVATNSASLTDGRLPFEALRVLRTRVGTMMENSMVSGVQQGELKRLYGSLSKDMEAAANAAGAGREFARQNQYWSARQGRVERVLERLIGNGKQPEEIFQTFFPKDVNQSNRVRATVRSLPADERKIVTNAVVDRLGRAKPGKQDETGDLFSSETFLTNWVNLSPGAKAQLFPDKGMRANLDAIAGVSSKIRHGSSSMSNPSGTSGSFAAYGIYAAPLAALTGNFKTAALAAGAVGAANISARMLTNPRVVAWMAKAPSGNPQRVAAHLARLSVIYNASDDEALKADLEQYVQSMNGEQ